MEKGNTLRYSISVCFAHDGAFPPSFSRKNPRFFYTVLFNNLFVSSSKVLKGGPSILLGLLERTRSSTLTG
jgi:hypothetical protein